MAAGTPARRRVGGKYGFLPRAADEAEGWRRPSEGRAGEGERLALAGRAADRRLDLLLTDYRLEDGETGLQTIEAVRRDLGSPVPALIISAEGGDGIRRLADPLGVPVLEKPVAETELRRVLGNLLAGSR